MHDQPDQPPLSLVEAQGAARRFYAYTDELLEYLSDPAHHLFPVLITVCEVVIDRRGRRTIVAEDERGDRHTVFTDNDLEPGTSYLMRSHTNPMNVDPVLLATELGPHPGS